MTGTGPKIVLPNQYADEVRNIPVLSLNMAFSKVRRLITCGYLVLNLCVLIRRISGLLHILPWPRRPSRIGLSSDWLIQDTVRIKLTQSLNLITDDLVEETIASVQDVFGDNEEWNTRMIWEDIIEVVARLSSRVFPGLPLCRNRRWLEIAKTYTVDSFAISFITRAAPWILRPLAYWANPIVGAPAQVGQGRPEADRPGGEAAQARRHDRLDV